MNDEFTVQTTTDHTCREGWGVFIDPTWREEDDSETIAAIDVSVVHIAPDTVRAIGGTPCVEIYEGTWCTVESFADRDDIPCDDTHDLGNRWFPTREDAESHATYTKDRWNNRQPWESFVSLGGES